MLLAEELALVAIKPESGRHVAGNRDVLNACLAGLLVADLLIDGYVRKGDRDDRIVAARPDGAPSEALLAAALAVVEEKGPKIKAVLSHMSRGLDERLGVGTWDAVVRGLVDAGVVGPPTGGWRSATPLLDAPTRDAIVERLRNAAASDDDLDPHTAVLLSMTGPGHLLEVVAPERSGRKHARTRIDGALDHTDLEGVGDVVRKVLAEAEAMIAVGATAGIVAASSG
jgi:Golgi phosphoprotein 3 (GPP34)